MALSWRILLLCFSTLFTGVAAHVIPYKWLWRYVCWTSCSKLHEALRKSFLTRSRKRWLIFGIEVLAELWVEPAYVSLMVSAFPVVFVQVRESNDDVRWLIGLVVHIHRSAIQFSGESGCWYFHIPELYILAVSSLTVLVSSEICNVLLSRLMSGDRLPAWNLKLLRTNSWSLFCTCEKALLFLYIYIFFNVCYFAMSTFLLNCFPYMTCRAPEHIARRLTKSKKGLFFCIRKLAHALEMSKAYSTQLGCSTCTGNRIIHGNIKTVDVIEEDLSQLFDKDIADDIEAYFSARYSNTRENDYTNHVYGQLK